MHSGDNEIHQKALNCPLCEQVIRNLYSLDSHIKIVHDEGRNFVCHCSNPFTNKEQFSRLTSNKHSDERPYMCEMGCDKSFASYSARSYHHKIVHEKQKFKCSWLGCQKEYSSIVHLERHLRRPHPLILQVIKKIQELDS